MTAATKPTAAVVKIDRIRVKRYLAEKDGPVRGEIEAEIIVGNATPHEAALAGLAFLDELAQSAPVTTTPATTAGPKEFTDTATGEVFDVADDGQFKTVMLNLFKRRGFEKKVTEAVSAMVLKTAKLKGFGSMGPDGRLDFLKNVDGGNFDRFKQQKIEQ